MIIDMHAHPWLMKEMYQSTDEIAMSNKELGWGLMSCHDMNMTRIELKDAKVDKTVVLPLDLTTQKGVQIPDNETVFKLVQENSDILLGFASVDPYRKDRMQVLEDAFEKYHLVGLKLNPCKQHFYPSDPMMNEIYEYCIAQNKPIIFHAGMSWEPEAPMKYAKPLEFEEVAIQYPELRFSLSHFGWPWIQETVAILLKYPNVYADTAMLYMDSPRKFMQDIFEHQLGSLWLENNLKDKVMFGSNSPRFKPRRIIYGLDTLNLRPSTREKIMGKNALRFLGMEEES